MRPRRARAAGPCRLRWAIGLWLVIAAPAAAAQPVAVKPVPADAAQQPSGLPPALMEADRVGPQALAHYQAGRYAEAEPLFLRALALRESVLGADHPAVLTSLSNLALLYQALGRYAEAEPLLRRVLEGSERLQGADDPETLISAGNLASFYQAQGRYAEAEPLLRRVLAAGQRALGPDNPNSLGHLNNLIALYIEQERFDDAEQLVLRALEAFDALPNPDNSALLGLANNLGSVHRAQGRYADAEEVYRGGLEASNRVLGAAHPTTLALVGNLGGLYQDQGRHPDAEPLLRRALDRYRRVLGAEHPASLLAATNLATSLADQDRLSEAASLYRGALEGATRSLGGRHPLTLLAAENLAVLALRLSPPGDALSPARRLVEGAQLRRRDTAATGQQGRVQQRREASSAAARFALFGDAAWAAAASDRAQLAALRVEAFAALQRSVAGAADRSIAEQAARRYAAGRDAALAGLIRERAQLEAQWSQLDERLTAAFGDAAGAGEEPASLRAQLAQVQARIAAIDARLRVDAPDYFALVEPEPVGVEAARALLGPNEAILLAVPSRFGTHVMAVTQGGLAWHRSSWDAARVRGAVTRLRWDAGALVDGNEEELARLRTLTPEARPSFDRGTAYALYTELIAPLAGPLAGKDVIYVAAGGSLAGLPFSILVAAPPAGADDDPAALRETSWFGDAAALVHIPSLQSLSLLRGADGATSGRSGFIGVGDPVLGAAAAERGRLRGRGVAGRRLLRPGRSRDGGVVADVEAMRALARLPGTAVELEAVRRTLGAPASALLLGERATEPAVRAADLTQARVIVFATHGLTAIEAIGVGEAGLVLTPPAGEPRDGDDGFLAASEVATLRLDADWVILSACNTATGDGIDNPGLGSLARAFLYAGARALLASHWPVSDDVAPILITRTLALEREGRSRGEALRQAMRGIRTSTDRPEWAHPFYWAPFVLIGG